MPYTSKRLGEQTPVALDATKALLRLQQGNTRFVASLSDTKKITQETPQLVTDHNPIAIILGCSDARVPAEMVFDQGLGDLFVIRVAGNVVAPSQIGSVEFAADMFGTRLVVVLGHSHCGAVTATVDELINPQNAHSPYIRSIVDRIRPSVHNLHELAQTNWQKVDYDSLVEQAIRANVRASVNQLKHGSQILENLIENNGLLIVGAEYNLQTGQVDFFEGVE